MSRGLALAHSTAVASDSIGMPIMFLEAFFSGGTVRAHNAIGTITWGGYDWLGVGTFGSASPVEESGELSRRTVTYTLSGIPSAMISTVLGESYQGRVANRYLGFLDSSTGALIATPELLDSGLMDVADIEYGETCTVTLTAESRVAAWDRPVARRYTDGYQQSRFPGDLGCQFVGQAAQKNISWGRKA